jgi:hypothetical protein
MIERTITDGKITKIGSLVVISCCGDIVEGKVGSTV